MIRFEAKLFGDIARHTYVLNVILVYNQFNKEWENAKTRQLAEMPASNVFAVEQRPDYCGNLESPSVLRAEGEGHP